MMMVQIGSAYSAQHGRPQFPLSLWGEGRGEGAVCCPLADASPCLESPPPHPAFHAGLSPRGEAKARGHRLIDTNMSAVGAGAE
jgi:hypothetical protein